MEALLTHEIFTSLLNTKFRAEVNDTVQVELQLDEVSELKLSTRQEQFALVFHGPDEFFLGQGMQHLVHDGMGTFDLFLVPIGHDAAGYRYEVVFNRLRKQSETSNDA